MTPARPAQPPGEERFASAVEDLGFLPVERHPTLALLRRAASGVRAAPQRRALACYLALAELLGCELVTADGRLSRASGLGCPVRLLSSG